MQVYMRTNIEIDDELVERAMKVYQLSTKRAVVELALQRLVDSMAKAEQLAMEGSGWDGELSRLREGAAPAAAEDAPRKRRKRPRGR
jgi:Arc/MetJ family transcription regulator